MLSENEYIESIRFMQTYKDALACVEQIAERRQAATHYEQTAKTIVGGVASEEVKHESGKIVANGEKGATFAYKRAFDAAKSLFDEHKFGEAADRAAFSSKLEGAMAQF